MDNRELQLKLIYIFTVTYLILFGILSLNRANYEFIFYYALMVVVLSYIFFSYRDFEFSLPFFIGFSIIGLLHVLGANIFIDGLRLYDHVFLIFRYDNFVHFTSTIIASIIAYNMLYPHFADRYTAYPVRYSYLIVAVALGMGAIVEIMEFSAVILVNAQGVGDYFNNAWDLVYNFLGAITGAVIIYLFHKPKPHKKLAKIIN